MPWYGFIHPLLAVATMVQGVRVAQVGMNKVLDWDFPLRRQRRGSVIFLLLCLLNLGLGALVNGALRGLDREVKLTAHWPLALAVTGLALLAVIVAFVRSRRPGELAPLMRIQHWLIMVPSVLILTMGVIGLLKLFGV
ncbi:MAG: hypothetical protein R6X14_07940 [bacterium]